MGLVSVSPWVGVLALATWHARAPAVDVAKSAGALPNGAALHRTLVRERGAAIARRTR